MKKLYILLAILSSALLLNAEPFFNENNSDFGFNGSDSIEVNQQTTPIKLSAYYQYNTIYVNGVEEGAVIDVYSLTGSKVITEPVYDSKIPANNLANGIYIVRYNNQTCKIVINE